MKLVVGLLVLLLAAPALAGEPSGEQLVLTLRVAPGYTWLGGKIGDPNAHDYSDSVCGVSLLVGADAGVRLPDGLILSAEVADDLLRGTDPCEEGGYSNHAQLFTLGPQVTYEFSPHLFAGGGVSYSVIKLDSSLDPDGPRWGFGLNGQVGYSWRLTETFRMGVAATLYYGWLRYTYTEYPQWWSVWSPGLSLSGSYE